MHLRTIGLFGKYRDPGVGATVDRLAAWLRERGLEAVITEPWIDDAEKGTNRATLPATAGKIDLGLVVGGDGTLLRVARSAAAHGIPLVGVNLGRLGFLTDIPAEDMMEALGRILDGQFQVGERRMLHAEVAAGSAPAQSESALNDVVVNKGDLARLIELEIHVNNEFVTSIRADGLIVATPTGSTAYALSAGGPILHPLLPALVVVPICPHTLSNRPIVLADDSVIDIHIVDIVPDAAHVSFDGHIQHALQGGEQIRVRRSDRCLRLVRPLGLNHYGALRSKLGWGGRI